MSDINDITTTIDNFTAEPATPKRDAILDGRGTELSDRVKELDGGFPTIVTNHKDGLPHIVFQRDRS